MDQGYKVYIHTWICRPPHGKWSFSLKKEILNFLFIFLTFQIHVKKVQFKLSSLKSGKFCFIDNKYHFWSATNVIKKKKKNKKLQNVCMYRLRSKHFFLSFFLQH